MPFPKFNGHWPSPPSKVLIFIDSIAMKAPLKANDRLRSLPVVSFDVGSVISRHPGLESCPDLHNMGSTLTFSLRTFRIN
ncbi:hypothetical protein V2G26_019291 [Clonostachys chloroleuca]